MLFYSESKKGKNCHAISVKFGNNIIMLFLKEIFENIRQNTYVDRVFSKLKKKIKKNYISQ